MPDEGGYPTEEELTAITNWPLTDCDGLWDELVRLWHFPTYISQEGGMWRLATGGWSGNEDIICALRSNHMFWMFCWQSSHRGGLHWYTPWHPKEK